MPRALLPPDIRVRRAESWSPLALPAGVQKLAWVQPRPGDLLGGPETRATTSGWFLTCCVSGWFAIQQKLIDIAT